LLVGSVTIGCFVVACADLFGIHNADVDGSAGDGAVSDVDGGPDDAIPPYDANKDVITIPDANLAQCDGGVDDITGAVFVSNSHPNHNTTGCGAATKPCSSIVLGIGVAAQQAPHKVVLANDTFDEVINLDQNTNGMTIEGGYVLDYTQTDQFGNPAWVPKCATNLAQIVETTAHTEPYVVHVNGASNITLRLMSIQSRTAATFGESIYGAQIIDSTVTIDNVVIIAENGGNGLGGNPGGSNGAPCGIDAGGATGGNAGYGAAGNFQKDGYHPATAQPGGDGDWGKYTPGGPGSCNSNCVNCMPTFNPDTGPSCNTSSPSQQCGPTGFGGCNGARGLGGGGGAGGGATVALFLSGSSNVTLLNGTTFLTALGGNGGNGASGGFGDAGTTGSPGGQTTCALTCGGADGGCFATSTAPLDGGSAGFGGPGGNGGTGGGGAGGPSYLVVRLQPAQLTPSVVTSIGDAGPGAPGDGGAPNGQSGDQAWIKVF
jgi:hypothetical protein